MEIRFEKAKTLKEKPDQSALGFGKYYTDHMLIVDWDKDQGGWHDARIVPYGPLQLEPSTMVLHYAQETFEGLKAYRNPKGEVQLFRPEMNAKRMQESNKRLCMPYLEVEDFIQCVETLVKTEQDWIPTAPETSLYIRPFMFATEPGVGVHPATSYKFIIILTPVGNYYPEGVAPVKIWIEDEYVRAVKGGTGFTKCGGNYAGSLKAQEKAEAHGYTQVLWLDGNEKKYVEEVGSMNIMFLINDTVVTAPTEGTVLPGVTRDSMLTLLRDWGYKVEERHLDVEDLMEAARTGALKEAWGTGTAAVISPVGQLCYKGEECKINNFETGELTQKLYDTLTGIQWGKLEDKFNWTRIVK
ncbi:branched-chain amino acid aminotransferase [Kandleria vitulina DSM 20405]|jgi:branched-chain amino acid aminotransferase|uniref:branched-chain-amino-acid transaminase n=1 Tax=Kandleria vitulina DSM 20405 TaxID=1410657 RepID=A0A0R2HML6_9FIRM|nr:branched-chain amino acid aminotransferase [Kandleria vitulina]KRN51340.1 branched-chain amino acid aminotransferase [Kandleria vitulina DSM 20405]MEE0988560.1 branched-chain amino acid aminotransferase [Kandleria vitulina]SDL57139.1 branched chain amino acid aminotransferase apoenzyme [Kandleria vitulina]SEJ36810.1 branched chain amino acid aminotransferase apoenzyme [Kandleria vitulina]